MNICYKCKHCSYRTSLFCSLKNHVRRKHEQAQSSDTFQCFKNISQKFHCKQCNVIMNFTVDVRKHVRGLPEVNTVGLHYKCKKCSFGSDSKFLFEIHQCVVKKDIHYCSNCSYHSYFKYRVVQHMQSKHKHLENNYRFECEHCKYQFNTNFELEAHVKTTHHKVEERQWFRCRYCDYACKRRSSLKLHVQVAHWIFASVRWFHCEHCQYRSKWKGNLKAHVRAKHTALENVQRLKCALCGYTAKNVGSLEDHAVSKHFIVV